MNSKLSFWISYFVWVRQRALAAASVIFAATSWSGWKALVVEDLHCNELSCRYSKIVVSL